MTDEDVDVVASDDPGDALDVRRTVFVQEQDAAPAVEFDEKDDDARHFVATHGGEPVGTARVRLPDQDTARVERVAVLLDHRDTGVGHRVMEAVRDCARERGRTRAVDHAQTRVRSFYASLGYEYVEDVEDETDTPP